MIHSMNECRAKLEVVKVLAEQGIESAKDIEQVYNLEQILQEVNYLLNESHPDNELSSKK